LIFQKLSKPNFIYFQKRRGISQIIGSLLLLAIVVPLGSVILFTGMYEINAFNNEMSRSLEFTNDGVQEDLIFEHVRFDPASSAVMISLRNAGTVETTIDRISILNMTNQKLIYKIIDIGSFVPLVIPLKNSTDIAIPNTNPEGGSWDVGGQNGYEYRISIITTRGNFFDTVVRSYNT
jgi:flagellin-like protein